MATASACCSLWVSRARLATGRLKKNGEHGGPGSGVSDRGKDSCKDECTGDDGGEGEGDHVESKLRSRDVGSGRAKTGCVVRVAGEDVRSSHDKDEEVTSREDDGSGWDGDGSMGEEESAESKRDKGGHGDDPPGKRCCAKRL